MLPALLHLLLHHLVAALRTTVPDEIIDIVSSKGYNRHHLPSQSNLFGGDVAYKRVIGDDRWGVVLDFHPNKPQYTVQIASRDKNAHHSRLIFSLQAAQELGEKLASVLDRWAALGLLPSATADSEQTLHSFFIRIDPQQRFDGELVLGPAGAFLEVVQLKGVSRKKASFPIHYVAELHSALDDVLNRASGDLPEYPTNVTIGIYIEGMSSFRAQSMDFHMDIYFSERWTDPRLAHSSRHPVLIKDQEIYDMLWHPDLYFANAKEARYHTVTSPNFMVWVFNNGTVVLDTRVSMVVNCMMDLTNYPLDDQECFLRILSYAYDIQNLNITWKSPQAPITHNTDIKLPDMQLHSYGAHYCDPVVYDAGTWACVLAVFKMERQVMHHVLQSYIPSALIVIISWFSFWLDVDAVPGRVSLCITTLLTLATQSSASRMALPQGGSSKSESDFVYGEDEYEMEDYPFSVEVSYAKAIDVWMGVCMAFVFGVMIEFTAVNYLSRRSLPASMMTEGDNGPPSPLSLRRRRGSVKARLQPGSVEFHNLLFDPTDCDCTARLRHPSGGAKEWRAGKGPVPSPLPTMPQPPTRLPRVRSISSDDGFFDEAMRRRTYNRKVASRVDKVSRFMFPFVFTVFNVIYWPYYIMAANSKSAASKWDTVPINP